MLPITLESVRLSLHILAAGIWVGGQLVLGGLIPAVRPAGPERIRAVAQAFQRIAWPAFAIAVLTGVWNLAAISAADEARAWWTTLLVKLALVAASGVAAAVHVLVLGPAVRRAPDAAARRRAAIGSGVCEGVSVLAGLAALFLGVVLAGQ
jgi:putative copper export protein